MDLKEHVIAVLAEQAMLDPGDIDPAQPLADLGIDSLALVETIFALEEAFDISIPFNANAPKPAPACDNICRRFTTGCMCGTFALWHSFEGGWCIC